MIVAFLFIAAAGCSGGGQNALTPEAAEMSRVMSKGDHHHSWGLWQFAANPAAGTLDFVQLRTGNLHLNALPFLEPPPYLYLTLESAPHFEGNQLDVDIGLRHPFLGLNEFTGFDVCGILITNGSVSGFADPYLRMAGEGNTRLLNPDGYSRWWNPAEFQINNGTIFGYTDGLLGAPDSIADYNSTLNGYKYFCDDLEPDDPLNEVTLESRGMFGAGQKNIRHYTIEIGNDGLIFNYAVDACWKFPQGGLPYEVPDSFPPAANRPEAWRVEVSETTNSLWNDGLESGGNLSLSIEVYDWFNADQNSVIVESPGNFSVAMSSAPVGGGAGYSTYEIDVIGATPAEGSIDLLIQIECEVVGYGGLLPGKTITAYFTHTSSVSGEPAGDFIYVDDSNTSGIEDGTMAHPYNTIQEGVDACPVDYTVLVDDSGIAYEEQVDMKSNITVQSSNWESSDGTGRAFIDGPETEGSHSVHFHDVTNATIAGFRIGFAFFADLDYPYWETTQMIRIDGGSNITVQDCLFTGQTDMVTVYPVATYNAANVTITNCRMASIDYDISNNGVMAFSAVYAETCPGLVVSNNVVTDIRSNEGGSHSEMNIFFIKGSADIVVKNNLIHHIAPPAPDMANCMKGFHLVSCTSPEVANNTVDNLDTSDAFMINQVMCFYLDSCSDVSFTNNIATHIYSSGFPPPLARGVQAVYGDVVCDFSDMYDVAAKYFECPAGKAIEGIGCVSANPLYIDPNNEEYDISDTSPARWGDPSFVDWDDAGSPSNDPGNYDTDTRSRMGCQGGPGGEVVGLLT